MIRTEHLLRVASNSLVNHRHICAFFQTPEEKYRVLLPLIRNGIERGEKAYHVVDPQRRDDHLKRLQAGGIDTAAEEQDGQLEVCVWQQAHLRGGTFDQRAVLALIEEVFRTAKTQGYRLTRLVTQMEWALEENMSGVNDLVEYETKLNYVLPKYKDTLICVYDYARFDADTLMDVLRTHPSLIIGGILQENPFFVPPGRFLQELRERNAYRAAS